MFSQIFSESKPEKICRAVSFSSPSPCSLWSHSPIVAGFVVGLKEISLPVLQNIKKNYKAVNGNEVRTQMILDD